MVLGNVIAIAQTNIKRMLAYSTIANMGYMLHGLPDGEPLRLLGARCSTRCPTC